MLLNEDEVYKAVTRHRRTELHPGLWEFLKRKDYVKEVLDGQATVENLIQNIREFEELGWKNGPRPKPRKRQSSKAEAAPKITREATQQRAKVIATILASDAANRPEVKSFREVALNNELLEGENVEAWIRQRAAVEGPPTKWLKIPTYDNATDRLSQAEYMGSEEILAHVYLMDEQMREEQNWFTHHSGATFNAMYVGYPDNSTFQGEADNKRYYIALMKEAIYKTGNFTIPAKYLIGGYVESLEYGVPGDSWQRSIPVRADGILDKLRCLTEHLAKRYGWKEAQATLFVLTGLTPNVATIQGTMNMKIPFAALSRITLSIDPSCSPSEVAGYYRRIRRVRYRSLSEKSMELALFMAVRPSNETWKQRMAAWNLEYGGKGWTYEGGQEFNFYRDCNQALENLLHSYKRW